MGSLIVRVTAPYIVSLPLTLQGTCVTSGVLLLPRARAAVVSQPTSFPKEGTGLDPAQDQRPSRSVHCNALYDEYVGQIEKVLS
jgi:hypothetical protein